MKEYTKNLLRIIRLLLFVSAIAVLCWGFTPFKTFFAGLLLGLLLGSLIVLHTAFRVNRFGEAVSRGQKRPGLGMATRLSLGALGALLVLRYPELFELSGLVLGIILPIVIALGDAIFISLKNSSSDRGKG